MNIRLIICGVRNIHIIGPCPECYETQGGMLVGTVDSTYKGRVIVVCQDCGKAVDYYIDSKKEKLWKLEPIESKGYRLPHKEGKTKLPK